MRARVWIAALTVLTVFGCSVEPKGTDQSDNATETVSSVIKPHIKWKTDETIKPTAIVLHWWAGWSGNNDIDRLVRDANNNKSTYNPDLKSTDKHPEVGHVTVQVGVTGDGKAYQLTSKLNSFARHAKCGNTWGIGIEIEGSGPKSKHYIGDNATQFKGVVATVKELMTRFDIKAESVVASDGKSGRGIVSHKQVDKQCQWADGEPAGTGKTDVDDEYLQRVLDAVK